MISAFKPAMTLSRLSSIDCKRSRLPQIMLHSGNVAIHGIRTCPDNTWCQRMHVRGPNKWYANWLNDAYMLSAIMPGAPISRYEYESRWFNRKTIKLKASNRGPTFATKLARWKEGIALPTNSYTNSCWFRPRRIFPGPWSSLHITSVGWWS